MEPVLASFKRIRVTQTQRQLRTHQKLFPTQVHKPPHAPEDHQSPAAKNLRKRQKPKTKADLQGKVREMELA